MSNVPNFNANNTATSTTSMDPFYTSSAAHPSNDATDQFNNDTLTSDNNLNTQRPEHHLHRSNEPLPGARGGSGAVDYSPSNIDKIVEENVHGGTSGTTGTATGHGGFSSGFGSAAGARDTSGTSAYQTGSATGIDTHGNLDSNVGYGSAFGIAPTLDPTGSFSKTQSDEKSRKRSDLGEYGQGPAPTDDTSGLGGSHDTSHFGRSNKTKEGERKEERKVGFEDKLTNYGSGANDTTSSRVGESGLSERAAHGNVSSRDESITGLSERSGHEGRTTEDPSKAGFGDKIVGKTQKVMGKIINNPEMQEKGELRGTVGKSAVTGDSVPRARD